MLLGFIINGGDLFHHIYITLHFYLSIFINLLSVVVINITTVDLSLHITGNLLCIIALCDADVTWRFLYRLKIFAHYVRNSCQKFSHLTLCQLRLHAASEMFVCH